MVLNQVWVSREPQEHINLFVFQLQMNRRERAVSKISFEFLDFCSDAKLKGTLSRRFRYIFVKMAQIFDKEPFFYHEIAVRAQRRKYQGIYPGKNNHKQFLTTSLQYTGGT